MPTRGEALAIVRRAGAQARVSMRGHPVERAREREIAAADVLNALVHARMAVEQMPSRRWRIAGPAQNGDLLTLIVILGDPVIVVADWRNDAG